MEGEAAELFVVVRAITSQFNTAMNEVNARLDSAAATMNKAGEAIAGTGKKLTHNVTLPILGIAAAGAKMSLDFHQQMLAVQTQAGGSAKDVQILSKQVLDLAKSVPQGPGELAKAMFHLKSLGLGNADAMNVLKQASAGAMTGMADLEETTNALGGAVRTNIKGAQNYRQAMATLNATVGAGNMRMEDLVGALGTGILPAAKTAGLSLRDVGAALATMTDENVPADAAATRLRMTFSLLAAGSQSAQKALHQVGLSSNDLGLALRSGGIVGAVQLLKDHLDKLGGSGVIKHLADDVDRGKMSLEQFQDAASKVAQFQVLSKAFGGGRSAGAIELLINNLGVLKGKYEQIGKTAGNFNKDVLAAQANEANKLKTAWSSVQVSLIKVGDVIVPMISTLMKHVAALADAFSNLPAPVQHMAVVAALLVAALGPALTIIGNLVIAIGFLVSPVGLAILALAALGVGLVLLYRHSAEFRAIVSAAFHDTQAAISGAMNKAREVTAAALNFIHSFWQRNGAEIRAIANQVKTGVTAAFHAIEAVAKAVWPVIAAIVRAAWNVIKAVVTNGMKIILDVVAVALAVLSGHWSKAWNELKKLVGDVLHGIGAVIKAVLGGLVSVAVAAARAIGEGIVSGILGGIGGLYSSLKDKLSGAIHGAIGAVKGVFGIHSPSTYTRDHLGKPLAEGVLQGYLDGSALLPTKISHSLRSSIDQARRAVLDSRGKIRDAFSTLISDADKAFELGTKQMIDKLDAQLSRQLAKLDAKLKAKLAAIQSQGEALTPAEAQLAALQSQQQGEQNAHDLAAAQQALAQAQAGGDAQQIADAQYQLQQVQENIQLQSLQKQADAERKARDAETKRKEDAAKAETAAEKTAAEQHMKTRKQQLEAERALEKKSMDQRFKALEKQLEKDPAAWAKEHVAVMKLLKKYEPDLFQSGSKMGHSFADGIRDAFADIRNAAREAAEILARYLQLHSPAKEGPLSTLDKWWSAFAPTILSGLDMNAMRQSLAVAASPALAVGASAAPIQVAAGGSATFRAQIVMPISLDGREIAYHTRDILVRDGRYNGGGILAGQS